MSSSPEEHRLLAHQADAGSQPAQVEGCRVDAVQQDAPCCGVVPALYEGDHSGLACTQYQLSTMLKRKKKKMEECNCSGQLGAQMSSSAPELAALTSLKTLCTGLDMSLAFSCHINQAGCQNAQLVIKGARSHWGPNAGCCECSHTHGC